MKIILTGSLGNISKPLAKELAGKGHAMTLISSSAERQKTSKRWARKLPSARSGISVF